jgi:hypothetical protein
VFGPKQSQCESASSISHASHHSHSIHLRRSWGGTSVLNRHQIRKLFGSGLSCPIGTTQLSGVVIPACIRSKLLGPGELHLVPIRLSMVVLIALPGYMVRYPPFNLASRLSYRSVPVGESSWSPVSKRLVSEMLCRSGFRLSASGRFLWPVPVPLSGYIYNSVKLPEIQDLYIVNEINDLQRV